MKINFLKNKNNVSRLILFLIPILAIALSYSLSKTEYFEFLEYKTFDLRIESANENKKAHKDIVVILIDDTTLEGMESFIGRWPWPRSIWYDIMEYISLGGAKAIHLDLLFTKHTSGNEPDGDDLELIRATKDFPLIHSFILTKNSEDDFQKKMGDYDEDFLKKFSFDKKIQLTPELNFLLTPFKELWQNAIGVGRVNVGHDEDGILRKMKLISSFDSYVLPSLALTSLKNENKLEIKNNEIYYLGRKVPMKNRDFYVPMIGNFEPMSLMGIISSIQAKEEGDDQKIIISPDTFKDKYVFIGASAKGLQDLKPTSLGIQPGVFFHASTLNSFLENKFIKKVNVLFVISIVFLLCLLISYLTIYSANVVYKLTTFIFLISIVIYTSFYLMQSYLWIDLILSINALIFTFIFGYMYRTLYERRDKEFIKKAFGSYVSPKLIEIMYQSGEYPTLGGVSGVRTAFFTDVEGFSSFSENMEADELVKLINVYLSAMTDILLAEDGTLDKYIGDAIVAFFGAPLPQEDHAIRAARVAINMQKKLAELRSNWRSEPEKWPEIVQNMKMRIGINTGKMVTGNVGSIGRMDYTMMGDAVNTAARLESACKYYGVYILISEETKKYLGTSFLYRPVDKVVVMGRKSAIIIYELIDTLDKVDHVVVELFEEFTKGMTFYFNQDFISAKNIFEKTLTKESLRGDIYKNTKTNPSLEMILRCEEFLKNPPPKDWNGTFTLAQK